MPRQQLLCFSAGRLLRGSRVSPATKGGDVVGRCLRKIISRRLMMRKARTPPSSSPSRRAAAGGDDTTARERAESVARAISYCKDTLQRGTTASLPWPGSARLRVIDTDNQCRRGELTTTMPATAVSSSPVKQEESAAASMALTPATKGGDVVGSSRRHLRKISTTRTRTSDEGSPPSPTARGISYRKEVTPRPPSLDDWLHDDDSQEEVIVVSSAAAAYCDGSTDWQQAPPPRTHLEYYSSWRTARRGSRASQRRPHRKELTTRQGHGAIDSRFRYTGFCVMHACNPDPLMYALQCMHSLISLRVHAECRGESSLSSSAIIMSSPRDRLVADDAELGMSSSFTSPRPSGAHPRREKNHVVRRNRISDSEHGGPNPAKPRGSTHPGNLARVWLLRSRTRPRLSLAVLRRVRRHPGVTH
ncbi:unnamed protein product [Urochloa decumbens]|uniref:Uncharacterized protein n=1 Tax=Urochloa decumbens TaxID=240449 RepID=A0ABC9DMG9_9POAL